jgi:tellurite resistance protein TerC
MVRWWVWALFLAGLFAVLGFDLSRHDDEAELSLREALGWVAVWVGLAVGFGLFLLAWRGGEAAAEYSAAYLIEWSLSVDNVFVFVLIFSHFAVPKRYQHRVLFWGVLGAVVMRLTFILAGSALLDRFHAVVYVFGALLLVTAARFLLQREEQRSLDEGLVLRAVRRVLPMTGEYHGQRLLTRTGEEPGGRRGRLVATPLLAVLILVEVTDVIFAVDSIPAVFAITRNAFIAFTSNAMAVLGLRSLYFVMAGAVGRLRYLKPALAVVLAFVGTKMLLSDLWHPPVWLSLAVILGVLGTAAAASAIAGPGHRSPRRL